MRMLESILSSQNHRGGVEGAAMGDIKVFVSGSRQVSSHARDLARKLGMEVKILDFSTAVQSLHAQDFLMFCLSGRESTQLVQESLKKLSQRRHWRGKLVLFSERAEPEKAAEWGRLVERFLPHRSQICLRRISVVAALGGLAKMSMAAVSSLEDVRPLDVEGLRKDLGLTQEQMAASIGVATRTVQNWESERPSPQAKRRLRDLIELRRTLREYMQPDHIRQWLTSPNEALGEANPFDLILEGRTRDVLLEFRRLQTGEPL